MTLADKLAWDFGGKAADGIMTPFTLLRPAASATPNKTARTADPFMVTDVGIVI